MAKKTKIERGDPVFVEWIDSSSYDRWQTVEYMEECSKRTLDCHSAGFLFKEDKDRVSICTSRALNDEGNYDSVNHIIVIPRVAIKSMRKLK